MYFEEEVKYILERYPKCDGITLLDETFTLNTKHAVGIANIFKKYGLKWECNSRVDTVNDEIIQALKDSNCQEIRLGIESGSQRMVDNMNKGINLEKAKGVISIIVSWYQWKVLQKNKELEDKRKELDSLNEQLTENKSKIAQN